MDFHQSTVPETDNDNQNNINTTSDVVQHNSPEGDTTQNANTVSGQEQVAMSYDNSTQPQPQAQQPYGNNVQPPYQPQQPYGNNAQSPYQPQPPYGNGSQSQYQVQQPYGNEGRYPYQNNSAPNYQNGNPYVNNNGYNYNNNGYNPNYGRYAYPMRVSEPGSKLANAAKILGIVSIVTFFTFSVYPAFITGSIAIVLALLSKGRRTKLLSNARIGIICAVIGIVANAMMITGFTVRFYTDDDFRAYVNQKVEEQYGQSLDEMLEEIMEENGYID